MGCIPNIPVTSAGVVVNLPEADAQSPAPTTEEWDIIFVNPLAANDTVYYKIGSNGDPGKPDTDRAYNADNYDKAFDGVVQNNANGITVSKRRKAARYWHLTLADGVGGTTNVHIIY